MKKSTSRSSLKSATTSPQKANRVISPDDRLGPDEPVDEATLAPGETLAGVNPEGDILPDEHRVRKIEPDDEHNNEKLVEEGMQGFMHGSLTKPRSSKEKK